MKEQKLSVCRLCAGGCGMILEVENNRIQSLRGDKQHPMSRGYACIKGLQADHQMHRHDRLLKPLKRMEDGSYAEIALTHALDEIAEKIRTLIAEDGPRSIATYKGTACVLNTATTALLESWVAALDSPSFYSAMTIDQSAKYVSMERLGYWAAGRHHMHDSDIILLTGANPLVSIGAAGVNCFNVTKAFKEAKLRGMKLIVVDPRRTETAEFADLFLQIVPGEDPALFAGMLRIILSRGWYDREFCDNHVSGLNELIEAVEPFTTAVVASRTGIDEGDILRAAEMFAVDAKRGFAATGTGPNMAPRSNLSEHLVELLNVVCGRYYRVGEPVPTVGLLRPFTPVAEVVAPSRSFERGVQSRSKPLGTLFGEMMTGALADEILMPGEGRTRALICSGGNPAVSFPDQAKTIEALQSLDLLVVIDHAMNATARTAHYVLPPKIHYERQDLMFGPTWETFMAAPFQQLIEPVVTPPEGAEVIDDWQIFWELAERLGLELKIEGVALEMVKAPTTEDILRLVTRSSAISIDDLKGFDRGRRFERPPTIVQPAHETKERTRFDVMPQDVRRELRGALVDAGTAPGTNFDLLLTSRRMREVLNSVGQDWPRSKDRYKFNPLYCPPGEMESRGLRPGQKVRIESEFGSIEAILEADSAMREGTVAMAHCWGALPRDNLPYEDVGACVNQLTSADKYCEPINHMPRFSAIPVRIEAL